MFVFRLRTLYDLFFIISAAVFPLYFTDLRMYIGAVILRVPDVMSLFLIVLFMFLRYKNRVELTLPPGFITVFLFFIYCVMNGVFQSDFTKAILASFQWGLLLTTMVIVYSAAAGEPSRFRRVFINTLLIVCFFTVFYHVVNGQYIRYKSLGDSKYSFALTGVILLTCSFFYEKKKYIKYLFFLYPVILLSLERKGILVFHLVFFFYCFFVIKPIYRLYLIASVLGALIVFFIFFDLSVLNFTFFKYTDMEIAYLDEEQARWISNWHRQALLTDGLDILSNNYIFGVGPKMLTHHMLPYYANSDLALYTHNVFLDTLIEQGVVGLILLLLPYFLFLYKNKSLKSCNRKIIFSGLCVYSSFMLFFMAGGAPSMILLYLPIFFGYVFFDDA
jgi:hypothetical protein